MGEFKYYSNRKSMSFLWDFIKPLLAVTVAPPAYYHFIMNQCSIQYTEVTNLSGNHMQSCYARTQDG